MIEDQWPDWEIYIQGKCKCVYCNLDGTRFEAWRHLQIDHLIPQWAGGANVPQNKVVSCCRCNLLKQGFDPSNGSCKVPSSDQHKKELISIAKDHLNKIIIKEREHFDAMMKVVGKVKVS